MLHKTTKEAHSLAVAIPSSHNLHRTITERMQKYYRLERTAYKNMANENGQHTTTNTIHSGYYPR
jgi:hypothetical protein